MKEARSCCQQLVIYGEPLLAHLIKLLSFIVVGLRVWYNRDEGFFINRTQDFDELPRIKTFCDCSQSFLCRLNIFHYRQAAFLVRPYSILRRKLLRRFKPDCVAVLFESYRPESQPMKGLPQLLKKQESYLWQ